MPRTAKANQHDNGTADRDGYHLTSGDMARLLHVDLKTIHNWVKQGHMKGRRTKGRHLRFDRIEVVHFMRQYGYPIPDRIGAAAPRVVVDSPRGARAGSVKSLKRGSDVAVRDSLFGCALELAAGDQEILVLDLDRRDEKQVEELMNALASREETRGVATIGVSRKSSVRRHFLDCGGTVTLSPAHESELRGTARWLTGASDLLPDHAEVAS